MIDRKIQGLIIKYLREFPVIVLLGPRQVGKTTLVKQISKTLRKKTHYFDLEKTSDFHIISRDPESALEKLHKDCVLIDEVQRLPQLFELLRALVDEHRKPARFILTGSASPELMKGTSETLAGRVYYFRLQPIGLNELPPNISISKHWFRGGFPKALTLRSNELAIAWLDAFITTYIERDLPFLFDSKISALSMRKLWGMLAHLHGSILNIEQLSNSLGIGATTVRRYLDYLEGAFLIYRLQPYYVNLGKRLVKAPKVYLVDSGILHFLLDLESENDLHYHPQVGASWEGYVIAQIKQAAPSRIDTYFYRTHAGAECDLVLVRGNTVKACIEIKLSKTPVPSKGFYQSTEDLKCNNNFLIVPDTCDYKNNNGVIITDIKTFIIKYLSKI